MIEASWITESGGSSLISVSFVFFFLIFLHFWNRSEIEVTMLPIFNQFYATPLKVILKIVFIELIALKGEVEVFKRLESKLK
jgi:succinate dehydrogenase hydrophobic anchor subunit